MTNREIIQNGHATLRLTARPILLADIASPSIQTLIADMKALLAKEKYGVALAAPQVGESLRLFIVSGAALARSEQDDDAPLKDIPPDDVYINPQMLRMSRTKKEKHEGCLSVRGKWGVVPRAEKASVKAYDENGRPFTRNASGFLAHIFQHEMDHLDGILYLDKAKSLYDDKPEDEKDV